MNVNDPSSEPLSRHAAFRLFWAARVAAGFALQMQAVAVGWQMYDLTQSAFDLGLVGLTQFLPAVAFILISGHLADRYDRRTITWLSQAAQALAVATLAAATLGGWITPSLILAMVFVIGTGRTFEHPSVQTLLPLIVTPAALPRAVAASTSATQTASIAGPAVGGFLYAVSPVAVYAVCGALWLLAGLLIVRLHLARTGSHREPISATVLLGGISFIRRNPIVLGAISLDMFAVLLGGATALLPIFARDVFSVGAWGLGLLRAAPAAGALAMSVLLAQWPIRRRVGRTMFLGVAAFGLGTVVFALSTSFWLAIVALAVTGAADTISVVIRQTLVQLHTPDEMRGRVYAVNSLFVGTSNQLGEFESGLTAHWFGLVPSVLIGGVGTVLVVLLWIRLFPQLVHADEWSSAEPVKR